MNESDKLRLIGGDKNFLADSIRSAIVNGWPHGIKNEKNYYDSLQFKLKGNPFESYGADYIQTAIMLTYILHNITSKGFKVLCSADVSAKCNEDQPLDLHAIFFN